MSAPQPGTGPLHRATTTVYWFLVLEGLFVLTTLPGLAFGLLLEQDASNAPLYALALVPVGPAVSATVFAWRVREEEPDVDPARHFWRGYRLTWADALRSSVPALAVLTVVGLTLAYRGAAGVGGAVLVVQGAVGVLTLLWAVRMLTVTSAFSFRWRDAARIAVWTLGARPAATLGLVSLVILTVGLAWVTFDAVVVLVASALAWFLTRTEAPVLALVRERFVAAG